MQDASIGGFSFAFLKGADYSKTNHTMAVFHPDGTTWDFNEITLPATAYVDLNTPAAINLSEYSFNAPSPLNKEEQKAFLKKLTPLVKAGLNDFSTFYANTIKKNAQFIGATYKYFYLPVLQ